MRRYSVKDRVDAACAGTHFSCFTSTKVQILTQSLHATLIELKRRAVPEHASSTRFTRFTSTKVQILTPEELRAQLEVWRASASMAPYRLPRRVIEP